MKSKPFWSVKNLKYCYNIYKPDSDAVTEKFTRDEDEGREGKGRGVTCFIFASTETFRRARFAFGVCVRLRLISGSKLTWSRGGRAIEFIPSIQPAATFEAKKVQNVVLTKSFRQSPFCNASNKCHRSISSGLCHEDTELFRPLNGDEFSVKQPLKSSCKICIQI